MLARAYRSVSVPRPPLDLRPPVVRSSRARSSSALWLWAPFAAARARSRAPAAADKRGRHSVDRLEGHTCGLQVPASEQEAEERWAGVGRTRVRLGQLVRGGSCATSNSNSRSIAARRLRGRDRRRELTAADSCVRSRRISSSRPRRPRPPSSRRPRWCPLLLSRVRLSRRWWRRASVRRRRPSATCSSRVRNTRGSTHNLKYEHTASGAARRTNGIGAPTSLGPDALSCSVTRARALLLL